jgi:hypothetical protein
MLGTRLPRIVFSIAFFGQKLPVKFDWRESEALPDSVERGQKGGKFRFPRFLSGDRILLARDVDTGA